MADAQACAALLEAWWATAIRSLDAPRLVNHIDSLSRKGRDETWNLVTAHLLEAQGDLPRALSAARRRSFEMYPRFLPTFLREEGRLAALTGDTAGAITAYRHYLALRWDPEPWIGPQVEQVRAELAAGRGTRGDRRSLRVAKSSESPSRALMGGWKIVPRRYAGFGLSDFPPNPH